MEIKTQSLTYFKANNVYTDEHKGMRFRLFASKNGDNNILKAAVWPCPWCYDKTDDEQKIFGEFELSESGIKSAEQWVCAQFESEAQLWAEHNKAVLF